MIRVRHPGFVLLISIVLFHLAAYRSVAIVPEHSRDHDQSDHRVYLVGCNGAPLASADASTTKEKDASPAAGPNIATAAAGQASTATPTDDDFSLWCNYQDCNPIMHRLDWLVLAVTWMLWTAAAIQHML